MPIPGDVRDGHGWKSPLMEPGVGVGTFAEGFVGQCGLCGVLSGNSADNPFLPTSLAV